MATDGTKGYGATLTYDGGSNIVQVRDMSGPGIEADDIDISNQDSPDEWREFLAGFADAGEVEFEVIYQDSQAAEFTTIHRVSKEWTLTLADGSTWEFSGYLRDIGNEVPYEDVVTQDIVIKISGKPTFTSAGS